MQRSIGLELRTSKRTSERTSERVSSWGFARPSQPYVVRNSGDVECSISCSSDFIVLLPPGGRVELQRAASEYADEVGAVNEADVADEASDPGGNPEDDAQDAFLASLIPDGPEYHLHRRVMDMDLDTYMRHQRRKRTALGPQAPANTRRQVA